MKTEQEFDSIIDTKLPEEKKKKFEDEYTIIEELSISKKVKIYKVQSKKDRLTCRTMHRIQKSSFCNINDDRIMAKEFELLSNLDHPNIIKLITFFTNDMNFNIISEYFKEGTLDEKIKKHKIFSENQAKYVCKQLLNGIKYLNEHNLVHTDINPDIIYIKDIIRLNNEELYNIKILQFGSSSINIHKSNNSLNYMAPEIIHNKYHQTSDIWSIGVILYQMVFDDLPFKGYKEDEIIHNILKLKPDIINKDASPYLKNLLKKMLNKNPFKRITVNDCLKHDWFSTTTDKYKKSNLTNSDSLKKFYISNIIPKKGTKFEKEKNSNSKNDEINHKNEKEKEKEKEINEKEFLDNSENSVESMEEDSSSLIDDEIEESKESEEVDSSISYTSFSPERCRSNSICLRTKNIFSDFGKRYKKKKINIKKGKSNKKKGKKIINDSSPEQSIKKKVKKDNINKNNINLKNNNNLISLNDSSNNEKKIEDKNQDKKLENLIKIKNKENIKHISLKNGKNLINSNCSYFKRSFSLSMDDSSDKSNGQKLSPLLIDTMKYMKYNIQINYFKNKELEKIGKIFNKIVNNKSKLNAYDNKSTYDDLYVGFLYYIGQKRFVFDSYSENKKIFLDLSKYINEDKKNGNIRNTSYNRDDFIRILIIFKEKYLEYRLKISYQKLKKSSTNEIFNCLKEIEQKSEYNNFKKYFIQMKNIMQKNKLKEIYLFFEYKNLIINSIKNIFIKEQKDKKKEDKQKKEKQNKSNNNLPAENSKNCGIKGIIRVVTKKDNFKNQNDFVNIDK